MIKAQQLSLNNELLKQFFKDGVPYMQFYYMIVKEKCCSTVSYYLAIFGLKLETIQTQ